MVLKHYYSNTVLTCTASLTLLTIRPTTFTCQRLFVVQYLSSSHCVLMFQHSTIIELKVSPEHGQTWNQSQKISPMKTAGTKHLQRKAILCQCLTFYNALFFPITILPWVCWPEVLFQWVDWAWNQTGITLLSHSGFTRFTYNSLLIVLDHQLILCSQEGFGCTLSTLCLLQTLTALQWRKDILHPGIGNMCSVDCICWCWFTDMLENMSFTASKSIAWNYV